MTKARDIASAIPAPSTVSSAELGFLDGVTSAIQTQIDTKAPSSTAVTLTGTQTLTNKTLTNPVIASVVNNTLTSTTGDMIYASAANTPARLGIGSSAQVLTVASGVPSWATPASGGGMTLISTTSLTGASVTLSSIPGTYNHLQLVMRNALPATDAVAFKLRFNSDSNTRYRAGGYDGVSGAMNATQGSLQGESDNTVSTFNLSVINIWDYANTTTAKFYYYQQMTTNFTTTTNVGLESGFSVYNQTDAITAITLFPTTGNWTSGSVLLYGVK
jgi:hypothetical protein